MIFEYFERTARVLPYGSHEALETHMRARHNAKSACTVRDIKQVLECTYMYNIVFCSLIINDASEKQS